MKSNYTCMENSVRLDVFLTNSTSFSRSFIKILNDENRIFVNGKNEKAGFKLKPGDIVTVEEKEVEEISAEPENIPLNIYGLQFDAIRVEEKKLLPKVPFFQSFFPFHPHRI